MISAILRELERAHSLIWNDSCGKFRRGARE